MAYLLKASSLEPDAPPLLGNGCVTCNNEVTIGSDVFCAVRADAIYKTSTSCRVLRQLLDKSEVGVRLAPACEDVSPEAEECPLLEDVTKQSTEDRD